MASTSGAAAEYSHIRVLYYIQSVSVYGHDTLLIILYSIVIISYFVVTEIQSKQTCDTFLFSAVCFNLELFYMYSVQVS